MATDPIGESPDVDKPFRGERQVLETVATSPPAVGSEPDTPESARSVFFAEERS
jgi:hypothetical protein